VADVLTEIEAALAGLETLEPILTTFVPQATPFVPLFNAAVAAVQIVQQDVTGASKTIPAIISDVINALESGLGLTPGTLAANPATPAAKT
jgi:hypothetical protein